MNGKRLGSGEEVTATGLKLIPDMSAPHSTTWVPPLCQEPATGDAGFLGNLSKCFLICPCLRSLLVWAASPSGCDHLLPDKLFFYLSSRPALLHLHKMNNQHFEEPFFFFLAPEMGLLRVYFSSPIKQMLPALWGIFCASQSLLLGGLPDALVHCRAARACQGGEWICRSHGKGNQSVAEPGGARRWLLL